MLQSIARGKRPAARSLVIATASEAKREATRGPQYDRLAPRRFEFVPLWGLRVFFLYMMRRVDCPRCGVTVEQVNAYLKDHEPGPFTIVTVGPKELKLP